MITKEDIRAKIDWEGWPDALEWLDPDEIEDDRVRQLVYDGLVHHSALQNIYDELEPLLGDDE